MAKQIWRLFIPDQAVGASLDYFDLFNATGSAKKIEISSVRAIQSAAVAVMGVVGVDFFLTKTSTIGTGGTAATLQQAFDQTKASFNTITPPPGNLAGAGTNITARLTPTGGATPGVILGWESLFTEETNAGAYISKELHIGSERILLDENSGILVRQGSVASVGNIGFMVVFGLISK